MLNKREILRSSAKVGNTQRRKYKFREAAKKERIQLTLRNSRRDKAVDNIGKFGIDSISECSRDLRRYQGVHVSVYLFSGEMNAPVSIYPDFRRQTRCLWSFSSALPGIITPEDTERVGIIVAVAVVDFSASSDSFKCYYLAPLLNRPLCSSREA